MAYQLWAAINDEQLRRAWSGVEMAKQIGVSRNTVRNLQMSLHKPEPATVHKIADGLRKLGVDITREQAEQMAGLRPVPAGQPGRVSVREAILAEPAYTDEDRETLLRLVDLVERGRKAS